MAKCTSLHIQSFHNTSHSARVIHLNGIALCYSSIHQVVLVKDPLSFLWMLERDLAIRSFCHIDITMNNEHCSNAFSENIILTLFFCTIVFGIDREDVLIC